MSLKRKASDEAPETPDEQNLFTSQPVEDRQSTFIAYFSPTLKPKELQKLAVFETADHKILAYRRESNQQSITKAKQYVTGSDDDDEKYAGKKVEKVLDAWQVEGACVVARWYGGVMLGPVRFTHIENCAKDAIRQWQSHQAESRAKKRKLEEEEAEHAALCKSLLERDQSILVLRALAAEKEQKVKDGKDNVQPAGSNMAEPHNISSVQTPSSSLKAPIDYGAMALDRLKGLERARDASLTFLLKRIDKAEFELASVTRGKDPQY